MYAFQLPLTITKQKAFFCPKFKKNDTSSENKE